MSSRNILSSFILWHFYEVPQFLLKAWKNYLQFSINFFSTPLLLKTLFAPWRRYVWTYPRGFNMWQYLETFLSNIISRVIGAICKIVLIVTGIIFQAFVAFFGAVIFLGWILAPILVLAMFLFAIGLINV